LDWATGIGARSQFPSPYTKASTAYTNAVKAQSAENWHGAVSGSQATIAAVAEIEALLEALQAKEAEEALARAKERLDWATGIGARNQFPAPYTKANTAYNTAVKAQSAENWHGAVSGSQATIAAVAEIEALLATLQAKEAEEALVRAKERLDWATGIGARNQFPAPYTKANTAYNTAVKAQNAENWHDAVSGSQATIAAVAEIEALLEGLQAKEAEEALARAKERLDWATRIGARNQFPAPYTKASTAYNTAVKAQNAENWHDAVSGSQATVAAVAEIEALLSALQAKEAEDALARAKERLDWATRIGARNQFPAPYTKASTAYTNAIKAQNAENWHDAVSGSQATIAAVAEIEALLEGLQAKEAEEALARAKERLDWATRIGARSQFPSPYIKASTAYTNAIKAQNAENWHSAVSGSQATIAAVAEIEALLEALQAKEAEEALARAKERLDWATGIGARNQFPAPYTKASTAYNTAIKAQNAKNWYDAVRGSQATIAAVAEIEAFLAALQAKDVGNARKVVETDTLPATEPRNPILSPIPEQPLKPMAPMPLNTEAPSTRSYIVQAGDSYRSIAKQLYGDVQMWRILYETNKGRMKNPNNPNLIFPGMTLDIPQFATRLPTASTKPMSVSGVSVQKEPQSIPEPVASRPVSKASSLPEPSVPQVRRPIPAVQEYTVKPGDSYWSIAYRLYGDVQHWRILYEANKGRMKNPNNPHLIFPGMVLTIPDSYLGDASRITAFIR
ncbi:MAG: LysM peptidoglycan-binding domain-containing protein, partial [Treponema sp.]|nr:LysM peptidoglycan-binding domain-containing protein [Treponema sp.]